jgi:tetratricopeptide (TPR) repeat protein
MPPPPQPMPQERPSFLGSGDSRGSIMSGAGLGSLPNVRPSVVYEDKDPTTVKGSDATSALDSLNNMWTVLETPDEPGPKKPVFKADPNSNQSNSAAPQGNGSGLGLNVKMVDHHAPPSREVIDKLEEALDGDDSEDQGVEPEDLMRLAHRLIALKQYDAALPYTLRAAKRYERRRGLHDLETMLAVMLAAKLLRRLSHFEKAIEYFALLLDIQEKILGTDHADSANTASALGQLYAATGSPGCELDRAVTCFNQVLHIREKLVEVETSNNGGYLDITNPSVQIHLSGCAMALHHLGVVHSDLFKYEEALGYFMRALKIRRSLGDIAEKDTASTLNNMAAVLHQLGRNEQCLAVYARSLEIKQKLLPPTHPSIADTLYNMGALNLEMNHPYEASEFFVQALTISTTKLGMHHPLTIDLQKQILTCEQLMAQTDSRHDMNRSRDSMNGFNNMNDSFIMQTYGPPPGSNASYSTGSFTNGGGGQGQGGNWDRGSFSNGSFTGVGGVFNNRASNASFSSYNNGGGGAGYRGGSFASYGGGYDGQVNNGQGGYAPDNEAQSNRKVSKGSSNDESVNTVLVPPKSNSDNEGVSPKSADGGPVRKRTGSSDGSVDSRRSLGGEGVSVQAPPMSSISNFGK